MLEQHGLEQVEASHKSDAVRHPVDLVIVNTCCVTHTASAKSRQYIRKAQKINPDAAIVVCGCLATAQIGELNGIDKNILVVGHRDNLAATVTHIVNGKVASSDLQSTQLRKDTAIRGENSSIITCKDDLTADLFGLPQLVSFKGQTRAFLKVQDGCDGYCSYCIVPKVRPFVQSKPVKAVIQEAHALVEAGHKEIVITGIFLGAYGQESVRRKNWAGEKNDKLADLLDKMAQIPNLARIRLSSLEPADVTPRLIEVFCKHRPIMPHLHLSLQSGSDAVLRRMCRQYTTGEFREKIDMLKSRLDRPAITTDIIAGFPGETDSDFQKTIDLAKEVGFAKMHIFAFSPRKGTAAAVMQGALDNRVIKKRSQILRELDIELGTAYRQQFVGEVAEILVENDSGQVCGRSERYFMVYLNGKGNKPHRNELVLVKLVENRKSGMIGEK